MSLSDGGSRPTAACPAPHEEGHRQLLTNACDEAPDGVADRLAASPIDARGKYISVTLIELLTF